MEMLGTVVSRRTRRFYNRVGSLFQYTVRHQKVVSVNLERKQALTFLSNSLSGTGLPLANAATAAKIEMTTVKRMTIAR